MNKIYMFFIKSLLCLCVFLILGIVCKLDNNYKGYIQKKLFQEYLDFSCISNFYEKYLGGIFPVGKISSGGIMSVFNDGLVYHDALKYEDGVMLLVDYNYLVPAINGGIIVYIGEKENYGKVVIVEGNDGIDIWYGNLCNIMVNIYDSVGSDSYLGESCNDKIYLVYTKKNKFLNYEDYLE